MTNRREIPTNLILREPFHDALRFSHQAMATLFEIFIMHEDDAYARQAAWEAFRELDRIEQELSRFIENSDISRINRLTRNQSIPVGLDAFECLKHSHHLSKITHGAFDIAFESLQHDSRKKTSVDRLLLDENHHSVQLLSDSIHLDLGGIGKGYALDRMAELLREWEISSALIHGGMSSVLALAEPPGEKGWPVTLSNPQNKKILARIDLKDRSLSGSGLQKGDHIIDPRTGQPVEGRLAAWISGPDAATSDALSTAFMAMTPEEIHETCLSHPDIQALVVLHDEGRVKKGGHILKFGDWELV
jgi:thiamine biosynthesis lipoprotein